MDTTTSDKTITPLWKRILFISLEVILIVTFLFYWVLKSEGKDLGLIPLVIIIGLVIYLHRKNLGTVLGKRKKYKSFRIGAVEDNER